MPTAGPLVAVVMPLQLLLENVAVEVNEMVDGVVADPFGPDLAPPRKYVVPVPLPDMTTVARMRVVDPSDRVSTE